MATRTQQKPGQAALKKTLRRAVVEYGRAYRALYRKMVPGTTLRWIKAIAALDRARAALAKAEPEGK